MVPAELRLLYGIREKNCLVQALDIKAPSPAYLENGKVENDPFEYWPIFKKSFKER